MSSCQYLERNLFSVLKTLIKHKVIDKKTKKKKKFLVVVWLKYHKVIPLSVFFQWQALREVWQFSNCLIQKTLIEITIKLHLLTIKC